MVERQTDEYIFEFLHKLLVILYITISMLIYIFYKASITTEINVKSPQFTLLGPYNGTEPTPLVDVYDQLIDLKNFSFKGNPQSCQKNSVGLLLVVIVSSKPSNYGNRMAIRKTWGRSLDSTKVVFLLGESENATLHQRIQNESAIFGDIVQGSFIDAYRNLTYKHAMGLKWVSHHCRTAKYVLKTDDDAAVNAHGLRKFLARELSPWGAIDMILCPVQKHPLVSRRNSKWVVRPAEYAPEYYPTYCSGYIIIYSKDVVTRLLKSVQSKPYFWIDDVQITGVAAEDIGVSRTSLDDLILSGPGFLTLISQGMHAAGKFLIGPIDINVTQIWQIYKAIKIL